MIKDELISKSNIIIEELHGLKQAVDDYLKLYKGTNIGLWKKEFFGFLLEENELRVPESARMFVEGDEAAIRELEADLLTRSREIRKFDFSPILKLFKNTLEIIDLYTLLVILSFTQVYKDVIAISAPELNRILYNTKLADKQKKYSLALTKAIRIDSAFPANSDQGKIIANKLALSLNKAHLTPISDKIEEPEKISVKKKERGGKRKRRAEIRDSMLLERAKEMSKDLLD